MPARRGRLLPLLVLGALLAGGCSESSGQGEGPRDLGSTHDLVPPADGGGPGLPDQGPADLAPADLGPRDSGPAPDLAGPDLGDPDQGGADLGFVCSSDGDCPGCRICDPVLRQCLPCECRADADCAAGELCEARRCVPDCLATGCRDDQRCDPELRRCVPRAGCGQDTDCPEGTVCRAEACLAADPWDRCDAALPLVPGRPQLLSTRRARDLERGSCAGQGSPEIVLRIDVEEESGLRLRVDGAASRFDARVFLRAGECSTGEELVCQDSRFSYQEVVQIERLPAGTYYAFVESFGPTAVGDFFVELELVPGGLCPDDLLEDADEPLSAADLALSADLDLVLCPADPDWYAVMLQAGDDLLLEVLPPALPEGGSPTFATQPLVSLLDPLGAELAADRQDSPEGVRARLRDVARAGLYRVWIRLPDDPAAERQGYRLRHEVFTREGSTDCSNPSSLRSGELVAGDTLGLTDQGQGSCCSELAHAAPERVYKIQLEERSSLRAQVQAEWLYALYLRRDCASAAAEAELACRAPGELLVPDIEAGTYFLFVDGYRDAAGPFTLQVDLGAPLLPPENDRCDQAQLLAPGELAEGTTRWANGEYRASCTAPLGHAGRDVVYRIELEQPGHLWAELDPRGPDGEPWAAALYLQQLCGNGSTELACDSLGPRIEADLEAGSYYLIVDGWEADSGPFTLQYGVD